MIYTKHILYPKQAEFVNSQARYTLYSGAVRGGKTLALIYRALALAKPHTRGLLGAFTNPMITDIIMPKLLDVLSVFPRGTYHFERPNNMTNLIIDHGKGPALIMLRHLENEGAIQGRDLDWYCIDEATVGVKENTFEMLNSRLSLGKIQYANIATNPGPTMHFLYKFFFEGPMDYTQEEIDKLKEKGSFNPDQPWKRVVKAKTTDNKHLPPQYLADLMKKPEAWRLRYMEGKWGTTEGIIYDEFDPEIHIRDFDSNSEWTYYLAIDFGFRNPFACLLIGRDHDGNYWACDEIYQRETTIPNLAIIIKERFVDHYPLKEMCCDLAAPGDRQQLEDELRIPSLYANKSVTPGIQSVKRTLQVINKKPGLIIHSRCINLRQEFESYEWEPASENRNAKEEPRKNFDHALDALRYLIHTLGVDTSNSITASFM